MSIPLFKPSYPTYNLVEDPHVCLLVADEPQRVLVIISDHAHRNMWGHNWLHCRVCTAVPVTHGVLHRPCRPACTASKPQTHDTQTLVPVVITLTSNKSNCVHCHPVTCLFAATEEADQQRECIGRDGRC